MLKEAIQPTTPVEAMVAAGAVVEIVVGGK